MDYFSHRLFPAIVLAVAVGVSPAAWADHAWGSYHWERSSNLVAVELGDNVDGNKWGEWLDQASSDWSVSSVLNSPVVNGSSNSACMPTAGRVEVCNDAYGNTGWLGVAQIWVSGGHITQAVAKMNDTYHDQYPYNQEGWRDLVMCQEVGHTFGLGHQDESFSNGNLGTCMDYTSNPDGPPANRQPNTHDYDQLEAIYSSHFDGGVGGGGGSGCWPPGKCKNRNQGPPPAFDMPLNDVYQWGRMIAISRDGGQSVFVQDFGDGYRVYTHVTWTLEMAERFAGHDH